jgi:hypothetical protein
MSTDKKHKHLEFIQITIVRMAANSFLLKAWSVTLVAGVFALSAKDADQAYLLVSFIPVILFWILDGYFLHLEKGYRNMYNSVRMLSERDINYDMNYKPYIFKCEGWFSSIFTRTLLLFYLGLLILISIIFSVIHFKLLGGKHG